MGLKATTLVPRCCLVSQKKKKMKVGGRAPDLSNITDRILAMSYHAELTRAMYQNSMIRAKEVLEKRHQGHYKVYNLCIDHQDDDPSHFNNLVERYPYDENHAPSLEMVKEFCESVHSWLSSDPNNVVFIHCMADRGQIGLMVSCYLAYKDMLAEEALQFYADKRMKNNLGVMIPSQRRYVNYWKNSLSFPNGLPPEINLPKPCSIELLRIRLYDTKNIDNVFFIVSEMQEVTGQHYSSPVVNCRNFCRKMNNNGFGNSEIVEEEESPSCLDYNFGTIVQVTGDVCVTFYEKNIGGRLFYTCFNTAFIENNLIQFSITELDKVGNKGKSIAGPGFRVELLFGPTSPNPNDS